MSAGEPERRRSGLAVRAAGVILRPARTWDIIETEPAAGGELYRIYVAPLAAIPPVCGVLGGLVFGSGIAGVQIRPTLSGLLAEAVLGYLSTLAGVWLLAQVIAAVSPLFGGAGDRRQALKLAAYSGTAVWAAGVFGVIPAVGFAAMILAGLYSLYVLRQGLPRLMRLPEPRALTCFAVIVLVGLALAVGLGAASAALRSLVGGPLRVVG